MDDFTPPTTLHRALASPVRGRLLELLRASPPLGVDELADHLDVHVNTVRTNLGILEDAGLVASEPEPRDRPGRPRLVYRATEADDPDSGGGYRFLAEVLTGWLAATEADPAGAGRDAGRAWGRHLVDRPAPLTTPDVDDALDRLVGLLDEVGFAPEVDASDPDSPRVLLRRCPFLDVARDHQDVVCSIHLGLMRGALDELGVDLEVVDLLPFVEPSLCVADLAVSP